MGGFNLPPGVSVSMIPGNRPEDMEEEAFWELLLEKLEEECGKRSIVNRADFPESDQLAQLAIELARDIGYQRGYNEGHTEAEMAIGMIESDVAEELQNWFYENQDASAKSYLAQVTKVRQRLMKKD